MGLLSCHAEMDGRETEELRLQLVTKLSKMCELASSWNVVQAFCCLSHHVVGPELLQEFLQFSEIQSVNKGHNSFMEALVSWSYFFIVKVFFPLE